MVQPVKLVSYYSCIVAEGWGASTVPLAIYFYTDLGSLASARSLIYYHGTRPTAVVLSR